MILNSSLIELKKTLGLLSNQLANNKKHILITNQVLHSSGMVKPILEAAQDLRTNSSLEKEYLYRSNVITLYGAVEHFIESLVDEYVTNLSIIIPSTDNLDNSIIDHLMEHGMDLLGKAERSGKFKTLKKIDVVESLYKTLKTRKNSLIKEFYVSSGGGNYNHEEISKCFVDLGLKNIRQDIKHEDVMSSYLTSQYGDDFASLPETTLYRMIDDLVERRNDLAHGGNSIPMLNDDDFRDYIDFVGCYSEALCGILQKDLAGNTWRVSSSIEMIPSNVYNNEIACFICQGQRFKRDGYLLYMSPGERPVYGYAKILSIQVNDVNYDEYLCERPTSIGFKLDKKINDHYRFKFVGNS